MGVRVLLLPISLILSLGCSGSTRQEPPPPPPPPPPPEFRLEITGNSIYYAGSQASLVSAIRGIESPEPIYWTVEGLGYLALDKLGQQPFSQTGSLYFIPPATIPGGGDTTAKVYYTTKDLYNGGMKKSPELIMQLKTLKAPMSYTSDGPTDLTPKQGESVRFGPRPYPVPFDFNPGTSVHWAWSTTPQVQVSGTFNILINVDYLGGMEYRAPAEVPVDFDVVITATMHDPWFNKDPVLTWTIHVKKP